MVFYGLSLMMMIPFGIVLVIALIAYLIYRRIQERKSENFEKRSN